MSQPRFTPQQVAEARQYWKDLTDADLRHFHQHYTTGEGRGSYSSVYPDTTFDDYLVLSATQSAYEKTHDI